MTGFVVDYTGYNVHEVGSRVIVFLSIHLFLLNFVSKYGFI